MGTQTRLMLAATTVMLGTVVQAPAAWIQTAADTYDYQATTNWDGGTIDDNFPSTLTLAGAQSLTFASGYTTSGALNFNYAGNYAMSLYATGANQTLTLGGDVTLNTTGGASANVGIGSSTAGEKLDVDLGSTSRTFTIASGRTLTLTNDVSNGGLIKSGAGLLTLKGANTYASGTTINGGTLFVTSNGNLGSAGTGLTFGGGTLRLGAQDSSGFALSRPITINAGGATLQAYRNSGTYTFDQSISGAGQLSTGGGVDWGTPTYVLSGSNTYSGTHLLNSSHNLELRSSEAAGSGPLVVDTGYSGRTIRLRDDASVTYAFSGITTTNSMTIDANRLTTAGSNQTLTVAALGMVPADQNDTVNITGGNGYRLRINSVTLTAGWYDKQLTLNPTSANLTVGTLSVASGGVFLAGTSADNRVTGVISGNNGGGNDLGRIFKQGVGTWTLEGANTYTGTTTIEAGTLLVNGSIASTRGTTVKGGILGGTGSIAGLVTVNAGATLAPGASIESLDVGSATLSGILKIELNDADPLKVDRLNAAGALDITNAILDFDVTGTPSQSAYVFATYGADLLTGTFAPTNVLDKPSGYEIDYNYQGLNQIALVVPEPAGLALAAAASTLLLARRHRRGRRLA